MDIRVLEFETRFSKGADGKPVERHWVKYAPAHNIQGCQTWDRVDRLKPMNEDSDQADRDQEGLKALHINAVWSQIGPKYDAWVSGEADTIDGTPLATWAGVGAAQVKELKRSGIRSVEELANASDTLISKIQLPNVRGLKKLAGEFISGKDAADLSEQLKAAMEVIADLKAQSTPKQTKAA